MATEQISTQSAKEREQLSEASLEGCYLETLLQVLEDVFEDIDDFCGKNLDRPGFSWVLAKARTGLNVVYMAQDKAGAVKRLTDEVERELYRATQGRPQ